MLKGFDPIIAPSPKILILGSMPSVTSLEKQEYYGFKHNRFWKIMQMVYHMPIDTYLEKENLIRKNHIVLWDVIGSCERVGSLDSNIKQVEVNDIAGLLRRFPSIEQVYCNGKKSFTLYQTYFSKMEIPCQYLPSTSNANRSIKEEQLFQIWMNALNEETE